MIKNRKKNLEVGLLIITVFIYTSLSSAEETKGKGEVPKIILSGLSEYKEKGPEAAIKIWIKGSAMEGNNQALSQANLFKQIESLYGNYTSYEVIRIKNITDTSKIIYLTINFEKGPVFARFLAYKNKNEWIIPFFKFHTAIEEIIPDSLVDN